MATARLYRRTEAGQTAWQSQDPRVPVEYRCLLGMIEADTHPDSLRAKLSRLSEAGLIRLLDQLVERGLLQAVEAAAHHDLDFTTNLKAA